MSAETGGQRTKVAVIGTGMIGSWIARHLAAGGHAVSAWNRTTRRAEPLREHGIDVQPTAAAAVDGATFVAIVVADDDAVADVLDGPAGVLAGITGGALVADLSTTSPASKRRSAELVARHGARFVDAPFFGSTPQAEAGALWPVVGCDDETFDAVRPYLMSFSDEVFRAGDVGAAAVVKLAGNLLVFSMVNGLAEALALLDAAGANPAPFMAVLGKAGFRSPIYEAKGRLMLTGDYTPQATMATALKDLGLLLAAAAASGQPLPQAGATRAAYQAAAGSGLVDVDYAAVFEHHRRQRHDPAGDPTTS